MKRFLPSRDTLMAGRWLVWARPVFARPELFRFRRESVARAAAVGVFFGFMVPVAQIPASVFFAILMRINIPVAAAATLINTPLTFGPVYYFAYLIGNKILDAQAVTGTTWATTGSALALGTLILAMCAATLAYLFVQGGWRWMTYRRLLRLKRRTA